MHSATTFRSKKEFVYETLREQILGGDLESKFRLVIDDLSADLGVSPILIREALQQLQSEGLVTIEPYVGARVAAMRKESIAEVFVQLEAKETISGREACIRLSEEDLEQIESLLHQMDASLHDAESWCVQNGELHQLICTKANQPLVGAVMPQIMDRWNRLGRLYMG